MGWREDADFATGELRVVQSLSFTVGWVVSLLAMAGVVTPGALGWRRRR